MAPDTLSQTGLVYVSDSEPGIRRQRAGRSFCYRLPDGALVRDAALKARISALGLPPAYENVWICVQDNGHLQATGYDARGRKQYRYHADWQALKSGDKFGQLIAFGRALPKLRRVVRRDLDGTAGTVDTMLAAITVLLDEAQLRVGNRTYAQENKTYGATTLLKRHVSLADGHVELRFTAKGGKRVRRTLKHPRLQRILEECADLPGRQLFVWRDEANLVRPVDSGRLNAYLADISGISVSAKTFRTWAGSLAAFSLARHAIEAGGRATIKAMAMAASEVLHNTPAIARSSYIHPDIIALAETPEMLRIAMRRPPLALAGLRAEEERLLRFLESRRNARRRAGRKAPVLSSPKA
ncbi:DNA topoisomerase IB [Shinella curvata]|uniref:DNA topoisomerase n=1 Tax=Shinella curvata TaxID=1817964 RepID=A0ABT8XET5_9HYPH|nr:DNA topoisomerase IB [Shinella curvata]MCJ8052931.1 DNA topoisomerase IB [Shinella curvata]MDO6122262.1 DNA topoisomerase IB [Shinella curvata]